MFGEPSLIKHRSRFEFKRMAKGNAPNGNRKFGQLAEGNVMRKRPDPKSCKEIIWSADTKEFLGRTFPSWGKKRFIEDKRNYVTVCNLQRRL